ncbi:undecaprenyl/decaprenyl-phosphate alpha-N-acetylglucosaminyl 1-phosphate transferase [Candidatus Pelagibacter sp.]|nr:undecaprenyl/decaprenyl-phosphate alpha-N-acetylglucosaminyl 1-phosphate transferase [Candidatus Pelagibacter sp.]
MTQFEIIIIFLLINIFFIISFKKIKLFHTVVDNPDNKRKFHKKPTALAGGIILIINIILYYSIIFFYNNNLQNEIIFKEQNQLNFFLITSISIFLLGFLDDKLNLKPIIKFFYLILIIGLLIYFDPTIKIDLIKFSFLDKKIFLDNYSFIFTLFCFLVFLNSFNMFDGINLQSSSYALIISVYFFFITQASIFIIILIIFLITFIYLNFTNNSFLGDSGSLLLSFILSFIFIKLFNENKILNSDTILIFMIIPGLDMIRLFFERIKNKKNPLGFDRCHLHHLLINKFNLFYTNLIISLLVITPIALSFLNLNKLIIIFFAIFIYTLTILYLKKIK